MSDRMTPRERVMAAAAGREVDCCPAICPTSVANLECMKSTGVSFSRSHTDGQMMADLAAAAYTQLGFDTVMPYFSVCLEASALGCQVYWGNKGIMPVITKNLLCSKEEFQYPKNFLDRPECKQLLKAIRLLRQRFGTQVAIIGKVVGPWTLAYHLYGVGNLVLDTILEPEETKAFIQALLPVSLELAKAQFEAGADLLTWADHVTADIISAEVYREFMLPVHKTAAARLQSYGPVILHTCGNVMDRLDLMAQSGFRIFHIDSRNSIRRAAEIAQGRILLAGAVNNPGTLSHGSRPQIYREVLENVQDGITFVAPECALPPQVRNVSLIELTKAAHRCQPCSRKNLSQD